MHSHVVQTFKMAIRDVLPGLAENIYSNVSTLRCIFYTYILAMLLYGEISVTWV
jgi:hypothetical protein